MGRVKVRHVLYSCCVLLVYAACKLCRLQQQVLKFCAVPICNALLRLVCYVLIRVKGRSKPFNDMCVVMWHVLCHDMLRCSIGWFALLCCSGILGEFQQAWSEAGHQPVQVLTK